MSKNWLRILGILCFIVGAGILFSVLSPIFSYELASKSNFQDFLSPIPSEEGGSYSKLVDYTKASTWFVGGENEKFVLRSDIAYYRISIPKLKIRDAVVAIGGEDLSKSLIQYPGTALPGKTGNTVIFGHSILPIFYNPENYMAIFSTLHTLKKGDEIKIGYDGIFYSYRVEKIFEVLPTQLEVLAQSQSDSFLSLITCAPPGDPRKPKRLVVKARIDPLVYSNGNFTGN